MFLFTVVIAVAVVVVESSVTLNSSQRRHNAQSILFLDFVQKPSKVVINCSEAATAQICIFLAFSARIKYHKKYCQSMFIESKVNALSFAVASISASAIFLKCKKRAAKNAIFCILIENCSKHSERTMA